MISAFTFFKIPQLICGPGAAGQLGKQAARFGEAALLVTGAGALEQAGHLHHLRENLKRAGMRVFHHRITGEPSPAMIDEAIDRFRSQAVDLVAAVGGGSVIDGGKAIAAMLQETGSIIDYLEGVGSGRPSGRSLPMIALPTTSGTGSEATKNAVISQVGDHGFKKSLRHDNYIPELAILDPCLCVSAPPSVTAACGMDALTQLIESYVSAQASPLTDALALDGLRHLIPALPDACGEAAGDIGCRGAMAYGAFLSGVTLAHAGLGVVHGVAGPMGGMIAIPHGVACANLLPYAVKATVDNLAGTRTDSSDAAIDKFARIGRLFGAHYQDPLDCCWFLVARLDQWLEQLAIPRLENYGLTADHVDRLVRASSNKNNPLPLSMEQIEQMITRRC